MEHKQDDHGPNEPETHSQTAIWMSSAIMRVSNPVFTDNDQRGRAHTMSSLGLTATPINNDGIYPAHCCPRCCRPKSKDWCSRMDMHCNSTDHSRGKCQRYRGAGYLRLRCPASPASYMATRQPVTTMVSFLSASQAINLCRRDI